MQRNRAPSPQTVNVLLALAATPHPINPDRGLLAYRQWVIVIAVPAAIGAAGTLWRRDPATGRRVVRLTLIVLGIVLLTALAAGLQLSGR